MTNQVRHSNYKCAVAKNASEELDKQRMENVIVSRNGIECHNIPEALRHKFPKRQRFVECNTE